jgi:trehalose 6-phosphate phosphatase
MPIEITPAQCALFLDFDGTLIDIASTPSAVTVSPDLVPLLRRLLISFESRVCIVTGRPLHDIRHFLAPLDIDVVAEHGTVQCLSGIETSCSTTWPASWHEHLLTLHDCIPNLVVETKTTSVALHYRQQPELEVEVVRFAEVLRKHAPFDFDVVTSNMTTEIRRKGIDKGTAIRAVMKTPRYNTYKPIFIADDETDVPGFQAVSALQGVALHVLHDFGGEPLQVRQWLDRLTRRRHAA